MAVVVDAVVHVAGLLLIVRPDQLADVERGLASLPGVDVHVRDQTEGRLVVTLETATFDGQQAGFAALSALPGVLNVDLVCHYVERGAQP